jgi:uncharacterized protein
MGNKLDRNGQIGLLAFFAKELGPTHRLGRKAFQKIVHLASDLAGVRTGYTFSYYTYGAYSRELASDLELAEDFSVLLSKRQESIGGYDIQEGPLSEQAIELSKDQLNPFISQLNWMISNFRDKSARMLELYSTIVFLKKNEVFLEENDLVERLLELKPKYTRSEVISARSKIVELELSLDSITSPAFSRP